MSPQSSGSNVASHLHAGFLPSSSFDPKDGGDMFPETLVATVFQMAELLKVVPVSEHFQI
jgi:hypothetical protein